MTSTYQFKRARVNLTTGEISIESIDPKETQKFIGGRGLATKWLYDEGIAEVDPLSPENKLVFINGPLTGSQSPTAGRYMVVTKAPLNGLIASANSGGVWGARLKYAGYDAIIVEGRAENPVYLYIDENEISLKDATEYWGTTSIEVDDALKQRYGKDASVLNIGPAGENQALLTCIMNDADRAAGRGGVGAVMGSKNLKAIVVKGNPRDLGAADKEKMTQAFKDSMAAIKANEVTATGLPTYGTAILVNVINSIGALPTKNWQESYFDQAEDISGEALVDSDFYLRNSHCHKCPIGCGRLVQLDGRNVGGPEYEPI